MIKVIHKNRDVYYNSSGSDIAQAISKAVEAGAGLGTQIAKNKGDKENLPLQLLQQKKAQESAIQLANINAQTAKTTAQTTTTQKKEQTKKILIISAISLVVIATGIGIYIAVKRKRGK